MVDWFIVISTIKGFSHISLYSLFPKYVPKCDDVTPITIPRNKIQSLRKKKEYLLASRQEFHPKYLRIIHCFRCTLHVYHERL